MLIPLLLIRRANKLRDAPSPGDSSWSESVTSLSLGGSTATGKYHWCNLNKISFHHIQSLGGVAPQIQDLPVNDYTQSAVSQAESTNLNALTDSFQQARLQSLSSFSI